MSLVGILHNYKILDTDITTGVGPAWNWVIGYALTIVVLIMARFTLVTGNIQEDDISGNEE